MFNRIKKSAIACLNWNRAIGYNNDLLFRLKKDMKFFQNTTVETSDKEKLNAVVMGSKTYFSIPPKFRPLSGRMNLIVSNNNYNKIKQQIKDQPDSYVFSTPEQSIAFVNNQKSLENLFVIGGSSLYEYFIKHNLLDSLILTEISPGNTKNIGNVFFPKFNKNNYKLSESYGQWELGVECLPLKTVISKLQYSFNTYTNRDVKKYYIDSSEKEYLKVLQDVLSSGEVRETRNSKTISKFGLRMEFDISEYFPLLTTKKMFWKGIVEELLWFLNANTNSHDLEQKGVNIWKGNSSRGYLDSIGLSHYQDGDCGPIYGYQWRHFNAAYRGMNVNYQGQGIDQLQNCLDLIRTNPNSRRIFMSGWNPEQMDQMALPPCHVSYQFYVDSQDRLSCQMYQRSGDLFLGVPFNIASTALLTQIMAHLGGKKLGKIVVVIGDAHIYSNHITQIKKQLQRTPYCFPQIEINNTKKINSFEDFQSDDFLLKGYYSHPSIKAEMVA